MCANSLSNDVLSQVDNLKLIIGQTATTPVRIGIVEHLLKDLSTQLFRLRDDALQLPETTAPILQKYLYDAPEVRDLVSVCNLSGGPKISFSAASSFGAEQLRRNAIASANGRRVRQLFVVANWLDIALDSDLVFAIQSLLNSHGAVRVVELGSADESPLETFTVFNLGHLPAAALVQHFNRTTRELSLGLTTAELRLASLVDRAESLWRSPNAFDISII
jgi:hypothetical protein